MSLDIWIVLGILSVAVVLFVTEWVRYDGVAITVLVTLAITGVIPMQRAIEGFASPAVITIAAVLVLSGGLYKTGVANLVGAQVMRFAGESPFRITALLMLATAIVSAFMNNIAAVAMLLPVALDISRQLRLRPSRLLIPVAFAALLGGMTTLIGTGPNILVSNALEVSGQGSFGMFSFTPVGAAALLGGTLYMALAGRFLRPERSAGRGDRAAGAELRGRYALSDTLFALRLQEDSGLAGRSLVEVRLGLALQVNLLAVRRDGHLVRAPESAFPLEGGDVLIVQGSRKPLEDLKAWGHLGGREERESAPWSIMRSITVAEAEIAPDSALAGRAVRGLDFAKRFQAHVVALKRRGERRRVRLAGTVLTPGDRLLLVGREGRLEDLGQAKEFSRLRFTDLAEAADEYDLHSVLLRLDVPDGSGLAGRTLKETRLDEAFDLRVLQIERDERSFVLPAGSHVLEAGDTLIVEGSRRSYQVLEALQELQIEDAGLAAAELESEDAGFAEVTLAPGSRLLGRTPQDTDFRDIYGVTLLSIWRGGAAIPSTIPLRTVALRFGDALLVYGQREKIQRLARDPSFPALTAELRELTRVHRAPVAALIMLGVILSAALGLLPVYIAALLGALLMVFTGCVKGGEVYSLVEWRVIVLLGGMLALGLAMQESGAAELIAREVIGRAWALGPHALLAGLFLMCGLAAQVVPTSVVAVLVAPIALSTATELGLSPRALLMAVAVASSCAFLSPFGHPVNLLVMGVGGYRVVDYTRAGVPLFLLLMLVVVFVLPVFWPLTQ
ncbi:MAG: SLC13 family permease [Gemmatimonadales bacterium]